MVYSCANSQKRREIKAHLKGDLGVRGDGREEVEGVEGGEAEVGMCCMREE